MPAQEPRIRIAIIGAGIAGITLALALTERNPNLHLTIFESRLRFSELSTGVGFGPNAIQAMDLISPKITAAYDKVKTPNMGSERPNVWYQMRFGDGPRAGELIAEVASEEGFAHCNASRTQFLANLVELLSKDVEVNFGKRVIDVMEDDDNASGKMRIRFEDGTEMNAHAVIGCDGIRSACRRILFGEEDKSSNATYTGKYTYRKVVDMKKAIKAVGPEAQNRQLYLGQGGYILTFPIRGGKALNIAAFRDAKGASWKQRQWVIPSTQNAILKDFDGWGERPRKLLKLVEDPEKWALFETIPPETYADDVFCILGDAAHATTPHLDAGAGFAIEDAHILSGLLSAELIKSPSDIKYAFRAYDISRRPRCQQLLQKSRMQGHLLNLQQPGIYDDKTLLQTLDRNQKWVWNTDLAETLQQAKSLSKITKCDDSGIPCLDETIRVQALRALEACINHCPE